MLQIIELIQQQNGTVAPTPVVQMMIFSFPAGNILGI
jgi:hypothetical protein